MNDMPEGPAIVSRMECQCKWCDRHLGGPDDIGEYWCVHADQGPEGRAMGTTNDTPIGWCPLLHKSRVVNRPHNTWIRQKIAKEAACQCYDAVFPGGILPVDYNGIPEMADIIEAAMGRAMNECGQEGEEDE